MSGLAESIRSQGLIQPVVVRPRVHGGYELIAGERRWRAAVEAGIATVPAVIREADDRDTLLLGLVENVAREDLSPIEEARAYAILLDEFGLSLGEVAERVGKSKPTVSNRVRLLELPSDVLELVGRGELTEGHARALLSIPDHDARRRLARRIVRDGMSVRSAERAAKAAGAATRERRTSAVDPALAQRVRDAFRTLTGFDAKVGAAGLQVARRRRRPARGARRSARAAARGVTAPRVPAVAPECTGSGSTISSLSRRSRRTTTRAVSSCAWRSCRRTAA